MVSYIALDPILTALLYTQRFFNYVDNSHIITELKKCKYYLLIKYNKFPFNLNTIRILEFYLWVLLQLLANSKHVTSFYFKIYKTL